MGSVTKNAHVTAARIAGKYPEMDAAALRVKGTLLAVMAKNRKTGALARSINIRPVYGPARVRDLVIESLDPNILSIEYGHWYLNYKNEQQWVPGIYVFRRAFNILKKG